MSDRDVVSKGPGRPCSPRHRVSFYSNARGSELRLKTWRRYLPGPTAAARESRARQSGRLKGAGVVGWC